MKWKVASVGSRSELGELRLALTVCWSIFFHSLTIATRVFALEIDSSPMWRFMV